jgi:hypothetical protein
MIYLEAKAPAKSIKAFTCGGGHWQHERRDGTPSLGRVAASMKEKLIIKDISTGIQKHMFIPTLLMIT